MKKSVTTEVTLDAGEIAATITYENGKPTSVNFGKTSYHYSNSISVKPKDLKDLAGLVNEVIMEVNNASSN